jgi:hypothetical protein
MEYYNKFFLVEGFEFIKKKGLIRLYRIKNNKDIKKITIKYIQDIEIEKLYIDGKTVFNGFKGPISCITQSSTTGNILITCFDGNIYLFTKPNLEIFEKKEKNLKI